MTEVEKKQQETKETTNKNWADDVSDNEEEDQQEIGNIVRNPIIPKNESKEEKTEVKEPAPPKKVYGPPIERVRNSYGDFVVTKILIPDVVVPVLANENKEEDSDEEEEQEEPT